MVFRLSKSVSHVQFINPQRIPIHIIFQAIMNSYFAKSCSILDDRVYSTMSTLKLEWNTIFFYSFYLIFEDFWKKYFKFELAFFLHPWNRDTKFGNTQDISRHNIVKYPCYFRSCAIPVMKRKSTLKIDELFDFFLFCEFFLRKNFYLDVVFFLPSCNIARTSNYSEEQVERKVIPK